MGLLTHFEKNLFHGRDGHTIARDTEVLFPGVQGGK
jgi:hypothetical protein